MHFSKTRSDLDATEPAYHGTTRSVYAFPTTTFTKINLIDQSGGGENWTLNWMRVGTQQTTDSEENDPSSLGTARTPLRKDNLRSLSCTASPPL